MRTALFALFYSALAAGLCMTARADTLLVSLSPDTLTGNPGATVAFFGTLTNTTASPVFINGDTFVFSSGAVDDSPFLLGPANLGPNQISASFELFDVIIPVGLSPAIYDGTFNVEGGPDSNADDLLGTGVFHVQVSASSVPEPSTANLVVVFGLSALLSLYLLGVIKRSRKSPAC